MHIDLSKIPDGVANAAIEYIFKASREDDTSIWAEHESVLIRHIIELFTQRGLDRLEKVQDEILRLESETRKGTGKKVTPPGMMERWLPAELSAVKAYLEAYPVTEWNLDDHMMAVEYVVQRYLPKDELKTEAEWLAKKSSLMGKVQANMTAAKAEAITPAQADKIAAALPDNPGPSRGRTTPAHYLSPAAKQVLDFASHRAAENVVDLADNTRHRMKSTILQHEQEKAAHEPGAIGRSLQTKLADEFSTLNRDWRRIAVTEAGEAQTQGFIASVKPGTKVQRIEVYASACSFCKKINGTIATVMEATAANKNPDTQVWPGKNNIGRSASPRKRVNGVLVDRDESEMWWLPAGLAHPHCRGRWVAMAEAEPGDDPDFAAWMDEILK